MSEEKHLDEGGAKIYARYLSREKPGVLFVWNTIECDSLEKNKALWAALWSGCLVIMGKETEV